MIQHLLRFIENFCFKVFYTKFSNKRLQCIEFFWHTYKNREEGYEKIIEMGKNNDYTTGNLLDHELKNSTLYKLIAVDLNKEIDLESSDLKQQINFIGTLDKDSKMFFIIEKSEETTVDFSQNAVTVVFLV